MNGMRKRTPKKKPTEESVGSLLFLLASDHVAVSISQLPNAVFKIHHREHLLFLYSLKFISVFFVALPFLPCSELAHMCLGRPVYLIVVLAMSASR